MPHKCEYDPCGKPATYSVIDFKQLSEEEFGFDVDGAIHYYCNRHKRKCVVVLLDGGSFGGNNFRDYDLRRP